MKIPVPDLRVFILGSYRSTDGSRRDFGMLSLLERHLAGLGYDSFLAINRDRIDDLDLRGLSPREKTLRLAKNSDLNLFVFSTTGVRNGLVAELTELQSRFPGLSWKHVALLEKGLALSSIIDESKGGILSVGPVRQIEFEDERDLLEIAEQVAFNYALAKRMGHRP